MFKKVIIFGFILSFALSSTLFAQTIIKDDFRVNDDYDVGGSNQNMPAIAMDHNGNFVVVWVDERNIGRDIYGQRFDRTGNPIGMNFKVNDTHSYTQGKSRYLWNKLGVAMDADGDFVVVWAEDRNKEINIYAQRYDCNGSPIGSNLRVNDSVDKNISIEPAVAMNPSGEFIVIWKAHDYIDVSLYGQRYSSTGDTIASNFMIVSSPREKFDYFQTTVAINPKGEFVATCVAKIHHPEINWSHYEIHAIRVNAKNEILGSQFKVNESDSLASTMAPDIAMDAPGNFVITWQERRPESMYIFAQRYNFKGETIGSNFRADDISGVFFKGSPKVVMNPSKEFIIGWIDSRENKRSIYLQYYNQSGDRDGNNFKVTDIGYYSQHFFDMSKTPSGYLALCWDGFDCKYDIDIFTTILNQKREIVKEKIKASNDVGSSSQRNPAVAASPVGKFLVSWDDLRYCEGDIFAQRFNSSGDLLGSNFKVNQDVLMTYYSENSSVSMDSSGNSIIAFFSTLRLYNIYMQRYDFNGEKLGENIKVSHIPLARQPDVVMDLEGNTVVVWTQAMENRYNEIFAQLYDYQGNKVGFNFMVSSDLDTAQYSYNPKVSKCANGNFVVIWESHHQVDYKGEIWGQLFDSSGNRIGDNFLISDSTISLSNYYPDVGMDRDGNFVVAWYGAGNILIQRYKADGSKINQIIKAIGHVKTKIDKISLAVKSSGEFIVVWSDFRNVNWDIYAQRFDVEGNPLGSNFKVNNDNGDNTQNSPVVAADDKNYYFAWVDNRGPGSGYDIYCKIISFESLSVSETELTNLPEAALLQNYPNPFNPITTLSFSLKKQGSLFNEPIHTTLIIYNILGQKVRTLVDEDKLPGSHQVVWDGKNDKGQDAGSGIYFYVLKAKDLVQTKKMTLIR